MNKYSKFFAFGAMAVAFASCSSDEPGVNPDAPGTSDLTETAYMKVAFRDANGGRATDNDFLYGEGDEGVAKNAQFFFFDANGVYVAQANYTPVNGLPGNNSTANPDENIEFRGDAVIVLDSLVSKEKPTYPNYMVTLLNCPNEYSDASMQGMTLDQFRQKITNWQTKTGKFRMTTTSYFKGDVKQDNHEDAYYYTTVITPDNFYRSKEEAVAEGQPVEVYVERLAARVTLDQPAVQKIEVTIAGATNDPVSGEPTTMATNLYVKINGWGLNATANESYLSKSLGDWSASTTFGSNWGWNHPTLFRSYWGQSLQYGKDYDNVKGMLTYKLPKEFNNPTVDKKGNKVVLYCNENTNNFTDFDQRLLTSAVVRAQVFADEKCTEPVDLVLYNGTYFFEEAFKAYVLGVLNTEGNLKYYVKTDKTNEVEDEYGKVQIEGENVYTQVDASMFELAGTNKNVEVVMGKTFPAEVYAKNSEGVWEVVSTDNLNQDLANVTDKNATAYNNGEMVYNIPIAHLNTIKYDQYGDLEEWYEGSFGVVRNHAYEIKINSIKRLGQGLFNPGTEDEEFVPEKDPKDPNWFLGATINILSWKIVNNSVDL